MNKTTLLTSLLSLLIVSASVIAAPREDKCGCGARPKPPTKPVTTTQQAAVAKPTPTPTQPGANKQAPERRTPQTAAHAQRAPRTR